MSKYLSHNVPDGNEFDLLLSDSKLYTPNEYTYIKISSDLPIDLQSYFNISIDDSGIVSDESKIGYFLIDNFTNGPSGYNKSEINISCKVYSKDGIYKILLIVTDGLSTWSSQAGTSIWNDITNELYDIIFSKGDTPPLSTSSIWIDTSYGDYIDVKEYIDGDWSSILLTTDGMLSSVYDEENRREDIFAYYHNSSVDIDTWNDNLGSHIRNELVLIHLLESEKEYFDRELLTQSEIDSLIDNTYRSNILQYIITQFNIFTNLDTNVRIYNELTSAFLDHTTSHITSNDVNDWDDKSDIYHSHRVDGRVEINASQIISGVISKDRLPPEIIERIYEITSLEEFGNPDITDEDRKTKYHNGNMFFIDQSLSDNIWKTISIPGGTYVDVVYNEKDNITAFSDHDSKIAYTNNDGETYMLSTSISGNWKCFKYLNDTYILLSNTSLIYSSDLITWNESVLPDVLDTGSTWKDIAYGEGKYVLISNNTVSINNFYSLDLITWNTGTDSLFKSLYTTLIAYGDNIFTVPVLGHGIYISSDGINWTPQALQISSTPTAIKYLNRTFTMITSINFIYYSSDAINWLTYDYSDLAIGSPGMIGNVENKYILSTHSSTILFSKDFNKWHISETENGYTYSNHFNITGNSENIYLGTSNGILHIPFRNLSDTPRVDWYRVIDSSLIGTIDYMDGIIPISLSEVEFIFSNITDKPSLLEGFGLNEDVYNKSEVEIIHSTAETHLDSSGLTTIFDGDPDYRSPISLKEFELSEENIFNTITPVAFGIQKRKPSTKDGDMLLPTSEVDFIIRTDTGELYKSSFVPEVVQINPYVEDFTISFEASPITSMVSVEYANNIGNNMLLTDSKVALSNDNYNYHTYNYSDSNGHNISSLSEYLEMEPDTTISTLHTEGSIGNWTIDLLPVSSTWNSIAYGNSRYILVGGNNSNSLLWSAFHLSTWTYVELPTSGNFIIRYLSDKFILFSNSNTSVGYYSNTGIGDWVSLDLKISYVSEIIRIPSGMYIAISSNSGNIAVSENGIDWIIKTTPGTGYFSIVYGNGICIAIRNGGSVVYSPDDGETWIEVDPGGDSSFTYDSIVFGSGVFIASSSTSTSSPNVLLGTIDGKNWTKITLSNTYNISNIAYGNGSFMIFIRNNTNIYLHSVNGYTWLEKQMPVNGNWSTGAFVNNNFMTVTDSNRLAYAPSVYTNNIMKPIQLPGGLARIMRRMSYGNGKFISAAYNTNKLLYSEDGYTWQIQTLPVSSLWYSTSYVNGLHILLSSSQDFIYYSSNAVDWNIATLPYASSWSRVTYNDGIWYIFQSIHNPYIYSPDLVNWKEATLSIPPDSPSQSISGIIVADDTIIITSNSQNNILYIKGPTTSSYNTISNLSRSGFRGDIAYGNGIYLTLNADGSAVVYTTDLINWYEYPISENPYYATSISFCKNIFIITGAYNYMLQSKDGLIWSEVYNTISQSLLSYSCYGDGKFVAIPTALEDDAIGIIIDYTNSKDEINWEDCTSPNLSHYEKFIISNNSTMIMIPNNITEPVSSFISYNNGDTWISGGIIPLGYSNIVDGIYMDNEICLLLGHSDTNGMFILSSTNNGTSWSNIIIDTLLTPVSITYNGTMYAILTSTPGVIYTSSNGVYWNKITYSTPIISAPLGISSDDNGNSIIIYDGTLTITHSSSGIYDSWTEIDISSTLANVDSTPKSICYAKDLFVILLNTGIILINSDGTINGSYILNMQSGVEKIYYLGSILVIICTNGSILYSDHTNIAWRFKSNEVDLLGNTINLRNMCYINNTIFTTTTNPNRQIMKTERIDLLFENRISTYNKAKSLSYDNEKELYLLESVGTNIDIGIQYSRDLQIWNPVNINISDIISVSSMRTNLIRIDGVYYTIYGEQKKIIESKDGILWYESINIPPNMEPYTTLIYKDGIIILQDDSSNEYYYSIDNMKSWIRRAKGYFPLPYQSRYWHGCFANDNIFVTRVTSNTTNISRSATSIDGLTWVRNAYSGELNHADRIYVIGTVFIAISGQIASNMSYSFDGVTWRYVANYTVPQSLSSGVYYLSRLRHTTTGYTFMLSSNSFLIPYTTNAISDYSNNIRPNSAISGINGWHDIIYANGKYILIPSTGRNLYSSSTITGTYSGISLPYISSEAVLYQIFYEKGTYFIFMGWTSLYYYYSTNGTTWLYTLMPEDALNTRLISPYDIVQYINNKFFFNGRYCSDDGFTWIRVNAPYPLLYIAYLKGMYVSVLYEDDQIIEKNATLNSYDGINWFLSTTMVNTISYCNDRFIGIAIDDNNKIHYSMDGIVWNIGSIARTSNTSTNIPNKCIYGNGVYIITYNLPDTLPSSINSEYIYSMDGLVWRSGVIGASNIQASIPYSPIIFRGGRFIILPNKYNNMYLYSIDGYTWHMGEIMDRFNFIDIIFKSDCTIGLTEYGAYVYNKYISLKPPANQMRLSYNSNTYFDNEEIRLDDYYTSNAFWSDSTFVVNNSPYYDGFRYTVIGLYNASGACAYIRYDNTTRGIRFINGGTVGNLLSPGKLIYSDNYFIRISRGTSRDEYYIAYNSTIDNEGTIAWKIFTTNPVYHDASQLITGFAKYNNTIVVIVENDNTTHLAYATETGMWEYDYVSPSYGLVHTDPIVSYGNGVAIACSGYLLLYNGSVTGINLSSKFGIAHSWDKIEYLNNILIAITSSYQYILVHELDVSNSTRLEYLPFDEKVVNITYGENKYVITYEEPDTLLHGMYISTDLKTWNNITPSEIDGEIGEDFIYVGNSDFMSPVDNGTTEHYFGFAIRTVNEDYVLLENKTAKENIPLHSATTQLLTIDNSGKTIVNQNNFLYPIFINALDGVSITQKYISIETPVGTLLIRKSAVVSSYELFTYSDNTKSKTPVTINIPFNAAYISGYFDGTTVFLLTASSDILAYSSDIVSGIWNATTMPYSGNWSHMSLFKGVYYAICENVPDKAATSNNGILWTQITLPTGLNNKLISISSNIALCNINQNAMEFDWRFINIGTNYSLNSIAYGMGKYIVVGYLCSYYSVDLLTWVPMTGTNRVFNDIVFGNGRFVAVADDGYVAYSVDGCTWISVDNPGSNDSFEVESGNGRFVAVADAGVSGIVYSINGTTWNAGNGFYTGYTYVSIARGNNVFIAVGHDIAKSNDGVTWTSISTSFASAVFNNVAYGNGIFVIIDVDGYTYYTSGDGSTISSRIKSLKDGVNYNSVAYVSDRFIACAEDGSIAYSINGITWIIEDVPNNTLPINGCIGKDNLFIGTCDSGRLIISELGTIVYYSSASVSNVMAISRMTKFIREIKVMNDNFILLTIDGYVGISRNFTQTNYYILPLNYDWIDIVYSNSMYFVISNTSQMAMSYNLEDWVLIDRIIPWSYYLTTSEFTIQQCLLVNGDMYILYTDSSNLRGILMVQNDIKYITHTETAKCIIVETRDKYKDSSGYINHTTDAIICINDKNGILSYSNFIGSPTVISGLDINITNIHELINGKILITGYENVGSSTRNIDRIYEVYVDKEQMEIHVDVSVSKLYVDGTYDCFNFIVFNFENYYVINKDLDFIYYHDNISDTFLDDASSIIDIPEIIEPLSDVVFDGSSIIMRSGHTLIILTRKHEFFTVELPLDYDINKLHATSTTLLLYLNNGSGGIEVKQLLVSLTYDNTLTTAPGFNWVNTTNGMSISETNSYFNERFPEDYTEHADNPKWESDGYGSGSRTIDSGGVVYNYYRDSDKDVIGIDIYCNINNSPGTSEIKIQTDIGIKSRGDIYHSAIDKSRINKFKARKRLRNGGHL